jgi:predicted kinase
MDEWTEVPAKKKPRERHRNNQLAIPHFIQQAIDNGILSRTPTSAPQKPVMVVLMGLPGSGKTLFSRLMQQHGHYVRINQDELGSRAVCLDVARRILAGGLPAQSASPHQSAVIDRCNMSREQRRPFIELAYELKIPVYVVWLKVSESACCQRCQQRWDHPTLAPGEAPRVIAIMNNQLEIPNTRQEYIAELHVVEKESDYMHVLLHLLTVT